MLKALRASKFFIAATALTATVALVGTSFAWFSSNANPDPSNVVTLGTLSVTQTMTVPATGFLEPGTYANVNGNISNARSNIGAMIRVAPGDPLVLFPETIPYDGPNTLYNGGTWEKDPNRYVTGDLDASLLGFGDIDSTGKLCKLDAGGNPIDPQYMFMWFTDPQDPGVYYCQADHYVAQIPVAGRIDISGQAGNNYQNTQVIFSANVFATQFLDGATSSNVWLGADPAQTWGVTVVNTPGAHQLEMCLNYVNQEVADGLITPVKAAIGSSKSSVAAARGAAILAHFKAAALGEK